MLKRILVICQDLFEKDFDMFFRKKGNFNRPMLDAKHKFDYFISLIDVSSDTPEYSWFLASNP